MIKKFMLVCSLMVGGSPWALAQTPQVKLASDGNLPMSISQLFEKIEDNNKELRTSKTGVEAANLGIESAKSKRLPDLDASLSFSYIGNALITDRDFSNVHGLKSPHLGNNFAFQAQQVVYAGGAINAGIKLAELGKLQAEVGVKQTRQQARFIALGQYLDLYKIDNRI
nr:TolC family protein [uncultured Prevotella sp.]